MSQARAHRHRDTTNGRGVVELRGFSPAAGGLVEMSLLRATTWSLTSSMWILGLALVMGAVALLPGGSVGTVDRVDSTADWLVASAVAEGLDPYTDLRDLAAQFEVPFWPGDDVANRVVKHPRTPGALMMLLPLSIITPDAARIVMVVAGLAGIALTWLVLSRVRLAPLMLTVGVAFTAFSGPTRWSYLFVTQSPIVMLCVAFVLVTAARSDRAVTGIALAIAGSLKAFPLVLIAYLVGRRRYKALAATVAALMALNAFPFLLHHMSLAAMIEAFGATSRSWVDLTIGLPGLITRLTGTTPSVVVVVALGLLLASLLLLQAYLRRPSWFSTHSGALAMLAAALLALPLSWPHYLLSLAPALVLAAREIRFPSMVGFFVIAGTLLLVPMTPISLHTLGLGLILVGVTMATIQSVRTSSRPPAPVTMEGL